MIIYYNPLWELLLKIATLLGLRDDGREQNWLNNETIAHLLNLSGFDVISQYKRFLFPFDLPFISSFLNTWIANLPILNSFCLTTCVVAKPRSDKGRAYSVSIIIPARNESGTIPKIIRQIPRFGRSQEIIFIEGHSQDNTWRVIQQEVQRMRGISPRTGNHPRLVVRAFKQAGKGKADAVKLGFKKAQGDVLMILDADLSVQPQDLLKFYEVIASGMGEFANGSRMIYPMEKQAMRTLNKIANRIFGYLFTWILGQEFNDTLCGTKVLFREDYLRIERDRKIFGNFDPFGDFDLIFGAIRQNLKVVEIPVRYHERQYGSTNINRFRHGLLLIKMTWYAFKRFRVI